MRCRSTFRVKFWSRVLTALNLLPSMATLAPMSKPIFRTQRAKLRAYLLDRRPIVLAKISNRLVARSEPSQQSDHFQVASGFPLQPSARLDTIEIAVDIEFQQDRWVVRGPSRCLRNNAVEAQLLEDSVARYLAQLDRPTGRSPRKRLRRRRRI